MAAAARATAKSTRHQILSVISQVVGKRKAVTIHELRKHNMVKITVKCEFDEYPYIIVVGEDSGNDLKFSSISNSGLGVVAG